MKKLNEIIDCKYETFIKGIKINSKEIEKGDLFVCTKGINADRHDFIDDAIKNGAAALITSHKVDVNIPYVVVDNPNEKLYELLEKFYDYPEKNIKIIGITGTDGKTSTTSIIQTLIGDDLCGLIGTNGRKCEKFTKDTNNTTPDIDKLIPYFKEFIDAGCKYVAMEASSEAFFNKRLKHISFDYSAYTNITSEHLNVHKTLENYIDCKKNLFRQTKNTCILNFDDEHFNDMKEAAKNILTYGSDDSCDLKIEKYEITNKFTLIIYKDKDKKYEIISPLLGGFNVYNLACALLTCLAMGFKMEDLIKNIKDLKVRGRLEFIDLGQDFKVMVDYAHTPNGILNLLKFVKELNNNRIIIVSGQAGERDHTKRHLVGEAIIKNCDHAIICYEDPRSENPLDIAEDMIKTVKNEYNNYEIVVDRAKAIKKAISMAKKNDIVLILGKGDETYEKLATGTIYFNDIEQAEKSIKECLVGENN